jgi:hypothetical protein
MRLPGKLTAQRALQDGYKLSGALSRADDGGHALEENAWDRQSRPILA